MGITSARDQYRTMLDNQDHLMFYETADDPLLGNIKIYRYIKEPLCYILKYKREITDSKKYNLFEKIQQYQASPLITLYGFRIERVTCCKKISKESVVSYWQYYNFYFNDYLEKRSMKGCMFLESELWHVVEVLCEGYSIFRKFGTFYEFDPRTFLITPEGKLKLSWIHLKSHNSHLKFISFFENKRLEKFFYSPEQLDNMFEGQRTVKLNFDKCISFRLGMILLYCLLLADPIYLFYNPSMSKINFTVLKNLIISKIIPSYSPVVVNLLNCLLKEDPKERKTPMQILENYGKYMNSKNQLRVCGGKAPGEGIPSQSSLNNPPVRIQQHPLEKDKSNLSDTKTVKMAYSVNNAL